MFCIPSLRVGFESHTEEHALLSNSETYALQAQRGNHRADVAAKSALDLTPDKYNIPYTDLKPKINNFLHKNGNNAGIEIPIINYSRLNPFLENGTQLSENREKNK